MLIVASSESRGEDVVHVAVGDNARARTKLTGEVLDYTGETLLLRLPGGNERAFPAARVFYIETARSPAHVQGDKLSAQRRYAAALAEYRTALDKETRRWVRREILARLTLCHRELGQAVEAGQHFLLLLESDPNTPYFDVIPLAWDNNEAENPALKAAAGGWLARGDSSAAQLLGASYLLSSSERTAAVERLKQLSFDRDPRVEWLARAQVWRVSLATASDLQVRSWSEDVEKAPEQLRGGGYLVLGRAWSARQQPARAALALLRVPILYPHHHRLGAAALYEAAVELAKIGQRAEAVSLYREVAKQYPDTPQAALAAGQLDRPQDNSARQ